MISPMAADSPGVQRLVEPLKLRSVIDTIPALVGCAPPDGSIEFVIRLGANIFPAPWDKVGSTVTERMFCFRQINDLSF